MGFEAESEQISSKTVPKLPLLLSNIPQMQSPQHPGMLTPPLHTTTASVPFRWEEEPGKPRPYTALTTTTTTKTSITNNNTTDTDTTTTTTSTRCLELPPRLLVEAMITKMPSPTTVLEGPYIGKPAFLGSSSFRFIEDGSLFGCEKGQLGAMLLSKSGHNKGKGFFGSSSTWGRRGLINFKGSTKRDVAAGEDSFVFSSSLHTEDGGCGGYISECGGGGTGTKVKMTRIRRNGSFLGLSHTRSHFLATIYEGLKQAIPWKSRKLKKDNLSV